MTSTLLWTLIAIQIAMAAFDTIYHHELTERLAWHLGRERVRGNPGEDAEHDE